MENEVDLKMYYTQLLSNIRALTIDDADKREESRKKLLKEAQNTLEDIIQDLIKLESKSMPMMLASLGNSFSVVDIKASFQNCKRNILQIQDELSKQGNNFEQNNEDVIRSVSNVLEMFDSEIRSEQTSNGEKTQTPDNIKENTLRIEQKVSSIMEEFDTFQIGPYSKTVIIEEYLDEKESDLGILLRQIEWLVEPLLGNREATRLIEEFEEITSPGGKINKLREKIESFIEEIKEDRENFELELKELCEGALRSVSPQIEEKEEEQSKEEELEENNVSDVENEEKSTEIDEMDSVSSLFMGTVEYEMRKNTEKERAEQEARERAEQEAGAKAEQEARERAEQEAREKAEQEARERAEQAARERAEQEARERAEQEAREKAEQEAREKAEQEARERAEQEAREKAEQEARAKAEQEARERAEQEAREKAEQEARERAEQEARERIEQGLRARLEEEAKRMFEQENRERAERLRNNIVQTQVLAMQSFGRVVNIRNVANQMGVRYDSAVTSCLNMINNLNYNGKSIDKGNYDYVQRVIGTLQNMDVDKVRVAEENEIKRSLTSNVLDIRIRHEYEKLAIERGKVDARKVSFLEKITGKGKEIEQAKVLMHENISRKMDALGKMHADLINNGISHDYQYKARDLMAEIELLQSNAELSPEDIARLNKCKETTENLFRVSRNGIEVKKREKTLGEDGEYDVDSLIKNGREMIPQGMRRSRELTSAEKQCNEAVRIVKQIEREEMMQDRKNKEDSRDEK